MKLAVYRFFFYIFTVLQFYTFHLLGSLLCMPVLQVVCKNFIFLPIFLSFLFSFCMSVCLYVCMSVCLYVCMSVCLYVCMSVCLYVCMSVCLYVCMSVCLHVCMSVCLYFCYRLLPFTSLTPPPLGGQSYKYIKLSMRILMNDRVKIQEPKR